MEHLNPVLLYRMQSRPLTLIKHGYLYNWYVTEGIGVNSLMSSDSWIIPSISDFDTMATFLGGASIAGGKLKEDTIYWNSPNTGATNTALFNGKGSGSRSPAGTFESIGSILTMLTTDLLAGFSPQTKDIINNSSTLFDGNYVKGNGYSIRPRRISTSLSDGESGIYIGNDGKVYRTICIGTQEWLADNLAETKYRNKASIPNVTDNTAWSALTTGARCAYNNDEGNVLF